jgi:proteasome lid subunit RPN8/RPN11
LLQLSHNRFRNRNFAFTVLQLPQSVYRQIRQHGEASYPCECCGILIGTLFEDRKLVSQAVVVENTNTANPNYLYEVSPLDLIRVERAARAAGQEILGFYHSHPDHPAHWSPTDLAEAHWLGCSYVITSIAKGSATDTRSFHLAGIGEDDKQFQPEEIQISQ